MNPRKISLNVLLRVSESGGYSNVILDHALSKSDISPTDARLVTALVYGVLERQAELDKVLSECSSRKLTSLRPTVLELLRMGAYQLLFTDKIPQFAAINETVKLAKKCGEYGGAGYINGVLRTLQRKSAIRDSVNSAIAVSSDYWYTKLWQEQYGEEITSGLLSSLSGRPPLTIRVNSLKTYTDKLIKVLSAEGVSAEYIGTSALLLKNTGSIRKLPSFQDGLFHVQDIASQICCEMAGVLPGETVIDVCAAPGGKSFTLAQMMNNTGKLLACDLYPQKVDLIKSGASRLGITIIETAIRDASNEPLSDHKKAFDVVICDLPCSGLGVLRRKPEIRDKGMDRMESLPVLQKQLLHVSAELVKPGGRLIYSTCTLNQAENQQVADFFLSTHPEFMPIPLELPEGIKRAIDEPSHCLTLFPCIHDTDGFYIAKFRRV